MAKLASISDVIQSLSRGELALLYNMRRPLARVEDGYASTKCLKEDLTIAGIYLGDPKTCCQRGVEGVAWHVSCSQIVFRGFPRD